MVDTESPATPASLTLVINGNTERSRRHRRRDLDPLQVQALDHAQRIDALALDAPDLITRKDLYRIAHRIRLRYSANAMAQQRAIVSAIGNFDCHTVGQIAEHTSLTLDRTDALLTDMVANGALERREPIGRARCGRSGPKPLYYLTARRPRRLQS